MVSLSPNWGWAWPSSSICMTNYHKNSFVSIDFDLCLSCVLWRDFILLRSNRQTLKPIELLSQLKKFLNAVKQKCSIIVTDWLIWDYFGFMNLSDRSRRGSWLVMNLHCLEVLLKVVSLTQSKLETESDSTNLVIWSLST